MLLFGFGTGPIKGFAVTLCIGLVTSMFTAIIVSRGVINYLYGGRRVAELSI
jgi:preprotein translocase subunit SecD